MSTNMTELIRELLIRLVTIELFLFGVADALHHTDCTRAKDVIYIVDRSSLVSSSSWQDTINFVSNSISSLNASTFGNRVARIDFGTTNNIVFRLNEFQGNQTEFRPDEKTRNLSAAINAATQTVLTPDGGDRPEVPDVLVVIVHGRSNDSAASIEAASRAKTDGIRVITIGISPDASILLEQLRYIASNATEAESLVVARSEQLGTLISLLTDYMCKFDEEANDGGLRQANSASGSGRLEVYVSMEYVTVCSNGWTADNTRVACRQLGYPDGVGHSVQSSSKWYERRIGLDSVSCHGNESRLVDCPRRPLFDVSESCDHTKDVILQCLCEECSDYTPATNIRISGGSKVRGRIEVFAISSWATVCNDGWSDADTRVVCRQLGFSDGAGTYTGNSTALTTSIAMSNVNCTGSEKSLFDCQYQPTAVNCSHDNDVYIQCLCSKCQSLLLQSPHELRTNTNTSATFLWTFRRNITEDFQVLFLSRKNPQLIAYCSNESAFVEETMFSKRIQLIISSSKIGFQLSGVQRTDMGTFAINIPKLKIYNSQAFLFVNDFAIVPEGLTVRNAKDSFDIFWDFSYLKQISDISATLFITTPATGRLQADYYFDSWLHDNGRPHVGYRDILRPTIKIPFLSQKDAGVYGVDIYVSSQWLNTSESHNTTLVVREKPGKPIMLQTCGLFPMDKSGSFCLTCIHVSKPYIESFTPKVEFIWMVDSIAISVSENNTIVIDGKNSSYGDDNFTCAVHEIGSPFISDPSDDMIDFAFTQPNVKNTQSSTSSKWPKAAIGVTATFVPLFAIMVTLAICFFVIISRSEGSTRASYSERRPHTIATNVTSSSSWVAGDDGANTSNSYRAPAAQRKDRPNENISYGSGDVYRDGVDDADYTRPPVPKKLFQLGKGAPPHVEKGRTKRHQTPVVSIDIVDNDDYSNTEVDDKHIGMVGSLLC